MNHPCPTCKKTVAERIAGAWPFCSPRCKMVDLGRWSKEEYRLASRETIDPNELEPEDLQQLEAAMMKEQD